MKQVVLASVLILGIVWTLVSFELVGTLLTLQINAENRLPFDLEIRSVDGEVLADNERIGVIYTENPVYLPKREERQLELFVRFTHTLDEFRLLYPEPPEYLTVRVTPVMCVQNVICVPIPLQKTVTSEELLNGNIQN